MSDRVLGYDVEFQDQVDAWWFSAARRTYRATPEGIVSPPDPFDLTLIVFVHGAEDIALRAWKIATAAYPDLPLQRPLADDEEYMP